MFYEGVKELKRGEVYYIQYEDGINYGMEVGRPAVIVSSNVGLAVNKTTVMVVYCTTNLERKGAHFIKITTLPRMSLVKCNEIYTVNRRRVGDFLGKLNEYEMKQIDEQILNCLGLEYLEPNEEEVEGEIECEEYEDDDEFDIRMEMEMYKRLYEKAMEKLVDLKFDKDLKPPVPVEEIPMVPYTPPTPVADKDKVNVNTATAKEISEKTGLPIVVAYGITGHRKKMVYTCLEDLLNAPRFTEYHLKKYGKRMTV